MKALHKIFYLLPVCGSDNPTYLRRCLESVRTACLPPLYQKCVIFCVDGSIGDELTSEIYNYIAEDTGCKLFSNTQRAGLAANLNNAIRRLEADKNDFFLRIDADDILLTNRISSQVKCFNENSDVDAVCSSVYVIDENNTRTGNVQLKDEEYVPTEQYSNKLIHPAMMLRGDFFDKYDLYDENYKYAQDWELWMRASTNGAVFQTSSDYVLEYRFLGSTVVKRKLTQKYCVDIANRYGKSVHQRTIMKLRAFAIMIAPKFALMLLASMLRK